MDDSTSQSDQQSHLTKRERRILRKQEKQELRSKETRQRSMTRWGIAALVVILVAGGAWWLAAAGKSSDTNANADLGPDTDPGKGPEDAKVIVREFSDFQCPACKATQPTVDDILAEFGDRIRFEYEDYPLTSLHKNSQKAAEGGQCAFAQDKFWEYHDKLFETQETWSGKSGSDAQTAFIGFAKDLGLDEAKFSACLKNGEQKAAVDRDVAEAKQKDVNATPTFFVNDAKVSSKDLKTEIEKALGS